MSQEPLLFLSRNHNHPREQVHLFGVDIRVAGQSSLAGAIVATDARTLSALSTQDMFVAASNDAPLLYVAAALRAKFSPWFPVGIGLGLWHLFQWSKDDPKAQTLAEKLLNDQIVMPTMLCITLFCSTLGMALYRYRDRPFHRIISSKITPLIDFLTHAASIGAWVVSGFGLVAVFSGAARHTLLLMVFVLYLVAMMEVSVGLWRQQGLSKMSPYLLSILMTAPFIAPIL